MAVNGFEGMVRPTIGQAIGPARGRRRRRRAPPPGAAFAVAAVVRGRRARRADAGAADARTPRRSTPTPTPQHPVRSAFADMREGFVYMVRTPWLLATLLFASLMILVMMGPLEVLIPFLDQGPARRRTRRPRARAGGVRHRRRARLAGDGVVPDAAALPHGDEPDVGRRAACRFVVIGLRRRRCGCVVAAAFVLGAMFSGADGHLGHAAPAPGAAAPARPGRLARLLRVDLA